MTEPFVPSTDELRAKNAADADHLAAADLQGAPARKLAVVACMDSRIDICDILGLDDGEAHIIRNAGGVITDDVIRSLCLSQRLLDTREIVLVHHTDCGLSKVDESQLDQDVRQSMERIRMTPFIPHTDHVRGFVYEVETGHLREVAAG